MFLQICLIALLLRSILFSNAQKIGTPHFFLQEGQTKCFWEDIPEDVPLTVTYKNEDNPGVSCSIQFKDPNSRVVMSRQVTHDNPSGKVSYLPKQSGDHSVCLHCESSQWFSSSQLKWTLSIDMGDTEIDYVDIAKMHHLEELESVLKLVDKRLTVLAAENEYQKSQEETVQSTSESMNARVMMFAGVQIIVLVVVTIFSIIHLSRYFHAQKLY